MLATPLKLGAVLLVKYIEVFDTYNQLLILNTTMAHMKAHQYPQFQNQNSC
ncbi:hypothetical protein TERTU_2868 [Teredinibacter turnerae T7901]|uniref:Uncharacterized protein n=1 Tax=Teredinibacter turnerae (strain ATCC 39867 / T7901) TaxID=377629 RepID=C5BN86_TERTT|nr:hypothetical protein TERTU_2868 [Teredinibacter turnerae T7901]